MNHETIAMIASIAAWAVVFAFYRVARRRKADAFAELAGVRRMPGESSRALTERAANRFRVIDGGRSNRRA